MTDETITRALQSLRDEPMPGDPAAIWLRARLEMIAEGDLRMRRMQHAGALLQILGIDAVVFAAAFMALPDVATASCAAAVAHACAMAMRIRAVAR
jgi:hypothetical protein